MKKLILTLFACMFLIAGIGNVLAITGSLGNARIIVNGNVGSEIEKTILVRNVNSVPINVTLDIQTGASFLDLVDEQFILQPNEERNARFIVTVPQGTNEGKIHVLFTPLQGSDIPVSLISTVVVTSQSSSNDNVAYIAVNSNLLSQSELVIRSTLIEEGYSVTVIDDAQSFDTNDYDLIVVGEGVRDVSANVDTKNKKVLFISSLAAQKAGLGISQGKSSSKNSLRINNVQNEITSEYNLGNLVIYNSKKEIYYLKSCYPAGAQILAIKDSSQSESVILAVDKGAMLINGACTRRNIELNERNLFFGLAKGEFWNEEAENLFIKSVIWVIDGNVNQAPVLDENIPVIEWQKNSNVTIDLSDYFSDPDGDDLDFDISQTSTNTGINLIINKQTGVVTFTSDLNFVGEDWIIFKAIDEGNLEVESNQVVLKVTELPPPPNTAPEILDEDLLIMELDEDFETDSFDLTDFKDDAEDDPNELTWSIKDKVGQFSVEISDVNEDILVFNSVEDATCLSGCGFTLVLKDSGNLMDEAHFDVTITPTNSPNLADLDDITTYSGAFVKVIPVVTDPDTPLENLIITYTYPLNSTGEWQIPSTTIGEFTSIVRAQDPEGNYDEEELKIIVLDGNTPVINDLGAKSGRENEVMTFEVEASDPTDDEMTLTALNLPTGATFNDNGDETGIFSWKPSFDQSGNYQVTFNVKDINNFESSKTISINIANVEEPPAFGDVDLCELKNNELDIQIKEPDTNDDFKISDEINVEIDVKNGLDQDLDVDLEVHLYDEDEDESVDDADDSFDVDKNDKETSEMKLTIPDDSDTDNEFLVLVIANGEDKNNVKYCNYEYLTIKLEREEHDVIISEIKTSNDVVSSGERVDVNMKVENIGEEDEDVYIEIMNAELNINVKGEEFELENAGDDDSEEKTLSFDIPNDIEEGTYEFIVKVFFDDGDSYDEEVLILTVTSKAEEKKSPKESIIDLGKETISLITETLQLEKEQPGDIIKAIEPEKVVAKEYVPPRKDVIKVTEVKPNKKDYSISQSRWEWRYDQETQNQMMIILDIALAIGIIIVAVGLIMIRMRR